MNKIKFYRNQLIIKRLRLHRPRSRRKCLKLNDLLRPSDDNQKENGERQTNCKK